MKRIACFPILVCIFFVACKKDSQEVDYHYDYLGNEEGRYVIYDVVEVNHLLGATSGDTSYYQLKTVIGDTIYDNSGRLANKFYRYIKNEISGAWDLQDTWMILIAENRGELIEENQRRIKLLFAPSSSKNWNANAFNVDDELDCYYDEIHESYQVGNLNFDSTVIVEQEDELNLIQFRRKYEVYAKGVGMIKKHYRHLEINNFNVLDVNQGKELFMDAIDFGVQ